MASGVDARLLKSTKFPVEFNQKVDMQKVNLQVIKKWIANKISEILGNEDDVVIELCFNLIEGTRYPDIKSLQIQLTGFLDKDTASFCKELWKLLLSAQGSPQGVPKELLEAKKLELMQEKMEAERAAETARKRREETDNHDRQVVELKERDRQDRTRDRPNNWQNRRGDRSFEARGRGGRARGGNRSRSPEPRNRDPRDSYGRDSYVPRDRPGRGRDRNRQRRRSRSSSEARSGRASSRSRSVSRSSGTSSNPQHKPGHRKRSRSRSPRRGSYRHGRDSRRGRSHRNSRRPRSRSPSSDRRSPPSKRRRHSISRSRSPERRRRPSARSHSSRSRSSSSSRSRSRRRSSSRSPSRNRHSRHRSRVSRHSDDENGQKSRHDVIPSGKDGEERSRRRNSSSPPPSLKNHGKPADISEGEPRDPLPRPDSVTSAQDD